MREVIRINSPQQVAATNDGALVVRLDEYDTLEIEFASDELHFDFLAQVAAAGENRHAMERLRMERDHETDWFEFARDALGMAQ